MHLLNDETCAVPLKQRPLLEFSSIARSVPLGREQFCLKEYWSLLVFHYAMDSEFDGTYQRIEPGYMALLPPGTHKLYYNRRGNDLSHTVFHFRYDHSDVLREKMIPLPKFIDLSGSYPEISRKLAETAITSTTNLLWAEIQLWDMLFSLSTLTTQRRHSGSEIDPRLVEALRLMEQHISSPLSICQIAERVGLSYGYFRELFKKEKGRTPLAFFNKIRMNRAAHLLCHSKLPIKMIAFETGYENLQHFNKIIHRTFGSSPRKLRQEKNADYKL